MDELDTYVDRNSMNTDISFSNGTTYVNDQSATTVFGKIMQSYAQPDTYFGLTPSVPPTIANDPLSTGAYS